MKSPFMDNDDDPNPSEKTILQEIIFVRFQDSEVGLIRWKYLKRDPDLWISSLRTFDTFEEALEEYLESRKSEPF